MAHGTARKLMRAATLSLLVFATTSGVVGLAGPAMADPSQSGPFSSGQDQQQPSQQPADPSPGNGATPGQQPADPGSSPLGIVGGLLGGGH